MDSFQGGSKANVSFGFGRFGTPSSSKFRNEVRKERTLRNTDSKTNQSGGSREASANGYFLQAWARNLPELWFTGFGKACSYTRNSSNLMNPMSLLNRMSSHANHRQGAWLQSSKTSSHSKRSACQRATSFNVAGWVQSSVTSRSWDHQTRPSISLVFVFFMTRRKS